MFLFRTFLTLAFILLPFFFLNGCGFLGESARETEHASEYDEIPEWLQLFHRQSGVLNFDFEPLDPAEIEAATAVSNDEINEQGPSSGAGETGPKPSPTGNPYEPGTLDYMIWQHKQKILSEGGIISPKPIFPGSPYEPGTLDDMLWQEKQRNLQQ